MRQYTVGALMTPADLVVTVRPDTPFEAVAALLAAHRVSGLPVLGRSGKVLGVVSEADLLPKVVQKRGSCPAEGSRSGAHTLLRDLRRGSATGSGPGRRTRVRPRNPPPITMSPLRAALRRRAR